MKQFQFDYKFKNKLYNFFIFETESENGLGKLWKAEVYQDEKIIKEGYFEYIMDAFNSIFMKIPVYYVGFIHDVYCEFSEYLKYLEKEINA